MDARKKKTKEREDHRFIETVEFLQNNP